MSDRFAYSLEDAEGKEVFEQDDGYVPGFMPGEHYGDYIILDIDINTGHVKNWTVPTAEELQEVINGDDE